VSPQPNLQTSDFAFNGAEAAFHAILALRGWVKILHRNMSVPTDTILEKSVFDAKQEKLSFEFNMLNESACQKLNA
jgi:hypothetical protein